MRNIWLLSNDVKLLFSEPIGGILKLILLIEIIPRKIEIYLDGLCDNNETSVIEIKNNL